MRFPQAPSTLKTMDIDREKLRLTNSENFANIAMDRKARRRAPPNPTRVIRDDYNCRG